MGNEGEAAMTATHPKPDYLLFERALPHQVRAMIAGAPIAYLPLGALEWHGEHAALGLDGLKAEAICRRAAALSGGVVFPPVYWGAFGTVRFPFTFHFGKRALRRQLRATLAALADWGFRSIVVLAGHYPWAQIRMARSECRRVGRERGVGALGIPEQALALDLGYLGDHAAKWETSLALAIDESLVDLAQLPDDTGSLAERAARHGITGVCPKREASRELGEVALATIATRLATMATRLAIEGGGPAEEIYRAYRAAFRRPLTAARTALGVQSAWEIARFAVGDALRTWKR